MDALQFSGGFIREVFIEGLSAQNGILCDRLPRASTLENYNRSPEGHRVHEVFMELP